MRLQRDSFLAWILIVAGIALRFTDLGFPDFATDEAQAALGATAAWTPAGMLIFRMTQALFDPTILVARMTSVIFGIALLPVIYALARLYGDRRFALTVTGVAAIFPSHVLMSRLAYLSAQLTFAWALILLAFLKARREEKSEWLLLLFAASVYASLIKTQAGLFPFALLIGRIFERRKNVLRDDIVWTLFLSLIPAAAYIATHPGIAATLLLYGGNMYGVSGLAQRLLTLFQMWWGILTIFLLVGILSVRYCGEFPWPVALFLILGASMGFLLGPSHVYYATDLVMLALPIGAFLMGRSSIVRSGILIILLMTSLAQFGPRERMQNRFTHPLYQKEGYWNTHAEAIDTLLAGEEAVTVLGLPGHHLRWYLTPRLLVGRNMTPPYPTRYLLALPGTEATPSGEMVYDDGEVTIVRQAP